MLYSHYLRRPSRLDWSEPWHGKALSQPSNYQNPHLLAGGLRESSDYTIGALSRQRILGTTSAPAGGLLSNPNPSLSAAARLTHPCATPRAGGCPPRASSRAWPRRRACE